MAPTIIADYFPLARRGQALSWFYIAIPVGGALGYVLGGFMAGINHAGQSWRWAFYAVVIPGLLLGLWSLAMRPLPSAAANHNTAIVKRPRPAGRHPPR